MDAVRAVTTHPRPPRAAGPDGVGAAAGPRGAVASALEGAPAVGSLVVVAAGVDDAPSGAGRGEPADHGGAEDGRRGDADGHAFHGARAGVAVGGTRPEGPGECDRGS